MLTFLHVCYYICIVSFSEGFNNPTMQLFCITLDTPICVAMIVCISHCYILHTLCPQVCNHPDLFEPRPTLSPFRMTAIRYYSASLVLHAMQYDPFKVCTLHVVQKTFVNLIWTSMLARDAHCVHVRFPLKFASIYIIC